jgi:hypothetical protein
MPAAMPHIVPCTVSASTIVVIVNAPNTAAVAVYFRRRRRVFFFGLDAQVRERRDWPAHVPISSPIP